MRKFDTDADKERVQKLYTYENEAREDGYEIIAGTDEAGRGSLFGPLVVAAVILPPNLYIERLDDSKKLSAQVRRTIYEKIVASAISVSSILVSVEEIDAANVYQATLNGMIRAINNLTVKPDYVLTDAMKITFGRKIESQSIIHGDALSASIAAASIIAKVTRDRLADDWSKVYPQYGLEQNRGYGTKSHLEAIKKFGYSPMHRRSFNPVKDMIREESETELMNLNQRSD